MDLSRSPALFMQIVENKRTVFFDDGAPDMVAPGVATVIGRAAEVVVRQLFVVLSQHLLIDRLVVIFMHHHRRRQARLDVRVIRRPAQALLIPSKANTP